MALALPIVRTSRQQYSTRTQGDLARLSSFGNLFSLDADKGLSDPFYTLDDSHRDPETPQPMSHSAPLAHAAHPPSAQQHPPPPVASSSSSNIPMMPPPPPPSHARPQRPLGKATSFADLRIGKAKLFKRFHHRKGDFDFGCAGEESSGFDGPASRDGASHADECPPPLPTKSTRLYDTSRQSLDAPQVRLDRLRRRCPRRSNPWLTRPPLVPRDPLRPRLRDSRPCRLPDLLRTASR